MEVLLYAQWERVVIWLPALVVGTGLVALVGVILVLTWLGVELPRE